MKYFNQLVIIISLVFSLLLVSYLIISQYTFVTGKYSKYCYHVGETNKNIKDRLYFKTLEECNKPLYK